MAVLVGYGDRLLTRSGRESWLKRPSVPLATFGRDSLTLTADGRVLSYLGAYERSVWVTAAVNKLNRSIAELPLKLYREAADGEMKPVLRHPLIDLMTHPWERAPLGKLKQKIAFPALIWGNSVLGKVRETPNGPPVGFVPLDWRFLIPHVLEDNEVWFWESTQPGRPQFWAPEDVVHFAFEAGDGDLGVSPLKQLSLTLAADEAAQTHQADSFKNGVRPAGALMSPEKLGAEQKADLRNQIRNSPSGSFFLLDGGLDWKAFAHTAVEAELIEQRKLNGVEVAAVYDIDPPLIGMLDHATYSNVGEMYKRFYGSTLSPWLTMISETLNAQVIGTEPAWRDQRLFFAFDVSEKLRSDSPEEIMAWVAAIAGGLSTPNEGRNRIKWGKVDEPDADKLWMPQNNLTPLGERPEPEPNSEPQLQLPPGEPEPESNGSNPVKANVLRTMERAAKKASAGQEPWDRERFLRELYQDAPDAQAEPLADLLEGLIARADGDPAAIRRIAASRFH